MHTEKSKSATLRLCPDAAGVGRAAELLRAGRLVAFPTETVYGLGADATRDAAVARIYAAKRRPAFNPLIAHVESRAGAERQGVFTREATALAEAFWPGPLTLVLAPAPGITVCALARAGLDSVALRVPAHPVAQALLGSVGRPLAAPSANLSGRVSAVTASDVHEDLDSLIDAIIDAGSTQVGLESTIVACLGAAPALLRPGGISRDAIEAVLGRPLASQAHAQTPRAPGMLAAHYAPRARLRLEATNVRLGEAGLDFGATFGTGEKILDVPILDLSRRGDLTEAAANLFRHLRSLDRHGAETIAVAPIPADGLGEAINDRLRRAAVRTP